ncbi:hypothetical protein ACX80W_07545 [Arthrobacter sp. TMN-37]
MAVTAKAFQLWRQQIAPTDSVSDLCRSAGIKRSTLAQQLVRGKVSVGTLIAVARGYGLDPVCALAQFEGYTDLGTGMRAPTSAELLSQVSHRDILKLLVARGEEDPVGALAEDLLPFPHRNSVRAWIDAIDPGDLRHQLSERAGIARQNLSAQLTAGRLSPSLAIEASRIAGVSSTSGLVVTGLLTSAEGGWPATGRADALNALSDTELVLLARDRLDALGKQLRKADADESRDRAIWENLG